MRFPAAGCLAALALLRSLDLDALEPRKFDVEVEQAAQLIVMINAEFKDASPEFGAGVLFGREKDRLLIATARHLLRKNGSSPTRISIRLRAMPDKALPVSLVKEAEGEMDLAVLSLDGLARAGIDACAIPFDHLGDAKNLKRGDDVSPVGNPNGVPWAIPVAADKVAQITRNDIAFQSTFISSGHSGGGLLDGNADLVGMTTADQPPFGRALSIDAVLGQVKQWGYPVQLRARLAQGWTPLHVAAGKGDVAAARSLLADCGNVRERNENGGTPLHLAASYGNTELLALLLKAGADPDAPDKDGDPPLEWAVEKSQLENVRFLLNSGASPNTRNFVGGTLLHEAAARGNVEIVKALIAAGAHVNAVDQLKRTPLLRAAEKTDVEIIKALVAAGADVNAISQGLIALIPTQFGTAGERDLDAMKVLVAAGARVDADALYWPIADGHADVVSVVLKALRDLNGKANDDDTLLTVAVRRGKLDIVRILVAAGADVNSPGKAGCPPLIAAIDGSYTEIEEFLVAHGAGVKGCDPSAMANSFWYAIINRRTTVTKLLLDAGMNPNTSFAYHGGSNPLCHAIMRGDVEIVRALVNKGADLATDCAGDTPLERAERDEQKEMIQILRNAGAKK